MITVAFYGIGPHPALTVLSLFQDVSVTCPFSRRLMMASGTNNNGITRRSGGGRGQ